MAYRRELDDSNWKEVEYINSYAVFMGYLSMAIKGLGFLILTWTTVVLLGGFVSMLQNKDFWCLTLITLVQTVGIFDVYQNEKFSYITDSARGLVAAGILTVLGEEPTGVRNIRVLLCFLARILLALVSVVVQILVLAILLCPLAAIYVFGLLISMGISIGRLIQHDYGGNSDGEANLKPAMDTLYCLALLQGLFFCYRFSLSLTRKRLANQVVTNRDDDKEGEVVLTYLRETRIGCEKDPSFAKGRNLITHAVDLIGSKSRDECLSGVKMLYTAICMGEKRMRMARVRGTKNYRLTQWKEIIGQHMMMKNLITSACSSPVLEKLLQTLDPRGAFDRETRNQGATIVSHLALDIHLEQFPGAIQYICSLIGSFKEYRLIKTYHRYQQASRRPPPGSKPPPKKLREAYEKLVLTGLCILWKLATHENNCRIMSHAQGLLPRIMAPLTSDIIHQFNGGAWSISVVEESLKVMFQLVAAPGETGAKLHREISRNKEAIGTMKRILSCNSCGAKLQKRAIGILMQIYMDNEEKRGDFIKMLLHIFFAGDSKDRSIRKLAGEGLAKLCIQGGRNTSLILQVKGDVLGRLTKILLLNDIENKTCSIRAAEILEHMCVHHTQNDECLGKLKKAMTDTMPKVLAQILSCEPAKDETRARTEENQAEVTEKEVDIENQIDHPQENGREKSFSSTHPQKKQHYEDDMEVEEDEWENEEDESENEEDEDFHAALLSLCVTVCDTFMSPGQDLACQSDAITLPRKLKDMVAKNKTPTSPCLRLMKLTCKMVISMMKHRGSYLKEDMESLTEALSSASEIMSLLDISMVFDSEDDGAATTVMPIRSLASLVREAKESVATYFNATESGHIEPFTSTDGQP